MTITLQGGTEQVTLNLNGRSHTVEDGATFGFVLPSSIGDVGGVDKNLVAMVAALSDQNHGFLRFHKKLEVDTLLIVRSEDIDLSGLREDGVTVNGLLEIHSQSANEVVLKVVQEMDGAPILLSAEGSSTLSIDERDRVSVTLDSVKFQTRGVEVPRP